MIFKNYLDNINAEVNQRLKSMKLKVSVAESLTGGKLSYQLMKRPGSSDYFLGGVVCYNTRLKVSLCGVNAKTIQEYGEVSQEVAIDMVKGIKSRTQCDIAIATTGVAGPANAIYPKESIGKVFIGISFLNKESVKKYRFDGNREMIVQSTCQAALAHLRDCLRQHSSETESVSINK